MGNRFSLSVSAVSQDVGHWDMAENTAGTAHAPERQRLRPERGRCGPRPWVLSGPGCVAASRVTLPCPPSPSASCPKRSRVLSSAPGGCRDFLVPREAGNRAGTRPPWPLTGCFSGVLGPCPAFRCERPELMTRLLSPEERHGHGSEQTVACWFKVWISRWTWRSTRPTVGFCPHYRALVNGAVASPEQCVFGEHGWW